MLASRSFAARLARASTKKVVIAAPSNNSRCFSVSSSWNKQLKIASFANFSKVPVCNASIPNKVVIRRGFASFPSHNLIKMPALSPTMTKGNIAAWLKKEGDKLTPGEVICEIETDKATVALEAQDEGFLAKILQPKGTQDVAIGAPLLVVVDKKDDVAKFKDYAPPAGSAAAAAAPPPPPSPSAAPSPAAAAPKPAEAPKPAPAQQQQQQQQPAAPISADGGRIFASPLAKALAKERGVELRTVSGSGPDGRIVKADVLAAASRGPAPATAAAASRTAEVVAGGAGAQPMPSAIITDQYTDLPHTNIRRIIASRLTQSKTTIPHYYLTIDCNIDKLVKLRAELNAPRPGEKEASHKLSLNDFIIKAAALACKKVPEANSSWQDQFVRRFHNVDVNVAVNTDAGLLTPLVRDADRIGIAAISAAVKGLAEKGKSGKLSPNDLQIGTFTISNLGMFGVKHFAAVILPPQACILAVGNIDKRVVLNEAVKVTDPAQPLPVTTAQYMSFTLSCDHRVVDGAVGAQWLQAFREYIEDPVRMLL